MTEVRRLQWPDDASERRKLNTQGIPRLLLVQHGAVIPVTDSPIEDWVWHAASEEEVTARVVALDAASQSFVAEAVLDEAGLLTYRGRRVALPPVEARLVTTMLASFGNVVSRDRLSRAAWGSEPPGRNALDVHVLRIRRRLEPVGLALRTVRSRGYLIDGS